SLVAGESVAPEAVERPAGAGDELARRSSLIDPQKRKSPGDAGAFFGELQVRQLVLRRLAGLSGR
ncbi:hypothetical protein AAIH64_30975, partial [Pseudomonas aeruginosa]